MIRMISALLLVVASVFAQTPIIVSNLAPVPRKSGWVTLVLPDVACPKPPITIPGKSAWQAVYGDKWGPRGRLAHIKYSNLGPFEQVNLTLASADPNIPQAPSTKEPGVAVVPTLAVRVGAATHKLKLSATLDDVPEGIWRTVIHGKGRVPNTMLVAHWWYYIYPGWRSIGFELVLCNSDPRVETPTQHFDGVALETTRGTWPIIDYHTRRGGKPIAPAGAGLVTPLIDWPTWLGDGQALAWSGRLLLTNGATAEELDELAPELREPVLAMAAPSVWKGHWGPWGELPKLHMNEDNAARGFGQKGVLELYQRFASKAGRPDYHPAGAIFAEPDWGNGWRPPNSGDHQDFGVTKLAPCLAPVNGGISHLYDLGMVVQYEFLRKGQWNYEADGNPLVYEQHPNCWFWGLANHYHTGASPDRLGKSPTAPDPGNSVETQDYAHLSMHSAIGWCQLTGSHMGMHMLNQVTTDLLLGSAVGRNLSEARGWGRAMTAMAWIWCVNGDPRLLKRLRDRFESSFDGYLSREKDECAPFDVRNPDPRKLEGLYPFWMAWQENICLTGIDAAYQVCYVINTGDDTGKSKAERVLKTLSRTIVKHGWWIRQGRVTVADAIWYDEGRALDPNSYDNIDLVWPHWPGTNHDESGSGALKIAHRWLELSGERELAVKAKDYINQLAAWFEGPNGAEQAFPRYSEWSATR